MYYLKTLFYATDLKFYCSIPLMGIKGSKEAGADNCCLSSSMLVKTFKLAPQTEKAKHLLLSWASMPIDRYMTNWPGSSPEALQHSNTSSKPDEKC